MRQRTGKTSNRETLLICCPAHHARREKQNIRGTGRLALSSPSSLGVHMLDFGEKPSSILATSSSCKPRLHLPPRRCRGESAARRRYGRRCQHPPRLYGPGPGASAVQDQPGTGLPCSHSGSFSTPRFVGGSWRWR